MSEKADIRNPRHELRFFLGLLKGTWRAIALSVALSCLQSLALFPIALLVNVVIDKALPGRDFSVLLGAIVAISALALAGGGLQLANRRISIDAIKAAIADLRTRLIKAQLQGSRKYYSEEDLDTLHSRIVQDTFRVDSMAGALLVSTIPGILIGIGLFLVLLSLNLTLSLVCVAMAPFFAAGVLIMSKRLKALIKAFHLDFSRYSKGVKFVLGSNELIKISTAESFENKRQGDTIESLKASHSAALWFSAIMRVSQQQLLMLSGAFILLAGGYFVIEGRLSLRVLRGILEDARGEADIGGAANGSAEHAIGHSIVFEKVSFKYNDTALLDGVDFSIHIDRNEIVNIHGLSGSGKSTLMYLLLGFYKPESGRILVAGRACIVISHDKILRELADSSYVLMEGKLIKST
ncbi:MAG: ABC transporter ATP-binding protein [Candidatus Shapirobacteria bacterium]|jgi:ATP-binding cassette subfamily B protein